MGASRRQVLAALPAAWAFPAAARAAPLPDALRREVQALIAANDVPGLGFGLVRGGKVAGVEAFGYADREARVPVTVETPFLISSVSKMVTATALMQLQEQGRFELDGPIAPHLDFPVANPRHGGDITFRQVLTHTSSIWDANYKGFNTEGDSPIGLREFLAGYLVKDGRWYTPQGSYGDFAPGERFSYSNVAYALAGYLCERIGGRPLKAQTTERIFRPLKMTPAAWSLADLKPLKPVTPYLAKDGKLTPGPQVGYPDWPAGLLRTSTVAMTRFLAMHAGGGTLDGARVLRPATVAAMAKLSEVQTARGVNTRIGLGWEGRPGETSTVVMKAGGDPGDVTLIGYDPATRNGAVILTNRDPTREMGQAMTALVRKASAAA